VLKEAELRIAQVTATFPPYKGGTGNVAYNNALELVQRGHEVHVFTARSAGSEFGNAMLLAQLLKYLHAFDMIHLHYPFYGGELVAIAAMRWRIPLVVTYHQDVLLNGALALIEKLMRYTLCQVILRCATCVLFTSQDYFLYSHARPLLIKAKTRIAILPNGVDTDHFSPGFPPVNLSARLKSHPNKRIILMVASLDRAHYFKGVEIFLKAISRMPANVLGVIVGDGELRSHYTSQTRALGLGARIHFAGRVSDEDLPDYYRLADVTVLPSVTRGEAFGLVLLESLACATPVIASDLPGVRMVVDHGRDGYLVQPGDPASLAEKLFSLLKLSPAQLEDFGHYGRRKVDEKYRWSIIGSQLEAVYLEILAERPSTVISPPKAL
jgi:glycosyltransferase involved in cell wall biosynthesis